MKVIKYNANNKHKISEDCVRRALSLAYNLPYKDVTKELNLLSKELQNNDYRHYPVWKTFIERHGCLKNIIIKDDITVIDFCKKYPTGIYILYVNDSHRYGSGHLTCIIDGNIYDSWDCSDYTVEEGFLIDKNKSNLKTDFLLSDYRFSIRTQTKNTLIELIDKYNLNVSIDLVSPYAIDHTTEKVRVSINLSNYRLKNYTTEFMIKVSYRTADIENFIKDQIEYNCKLIIKEVKKLIKEKEDN